VRIYATTEHNAGDITQRFCAHLAALNLSSYAAVEWHKDNGNRVVSAVLLPHAFSDLTPGFNTMGLCNSLDLSPASNNQDLEREIVLAMLASPLPFAYPSFQEFTSAVSVRSNIVRNARLTALAFDTEHAERPEEFWDYHPDRGFTLKAGRPLIEALQKTTQPDRSNKLYSFSCYRATEYVILLSVAQELQLCNPQQFAQLQRQWETRAIMSGQFHDVFLREYGSLQEPLPPRYYVPGDRLWFRNPDEFSSNAEGYEGSWVFYLGNGLFTNFWKRDQPFTLTTKAVELYHWRHATYRHADGRLLVDDNVVDEHVAETLKDPQKVQRILERMLRLRDPSGTYAQGGCIDATRECVRLLRPGTTELQFPDGVQQKATTPT
jgi:hypothetical protein